MPDSDRSRGRSVELLITALITMAITLLMMLLSSLGGGFAATGASIAAGGLTPAIIIHLATALPALLVGPFILARRKGDRTHRTLGRLWVTLMLITAIASAFIRAPGAGIAGTGFSFIHIFTIWTLVNAPLGIWLARKGNIRAHRGVMTGLYVGLCVAGAFTFVPGRLLGQLVFG